MLQKREILEENLSKIITEIKYDKEKVKKIKKGMKEYGFTVGEIQGYFVDTEEKLPELDIRVLALLTQEVYMNTIDDSIKTDIYFTDIEMKQARTFDYSVIKEFERVEFPIVMPNVLMINSENYLTYWDIHFIKKLMDNQLLRYNFETQREHTKVKRRDSFQRVINVNSKSVEEITELELKGELEITKLTINALVGTADEGEELTYNTKKLQLEVNEGTFLDIVDGYHRITGALNSLEIDPEINQIFEVSIKNFNTKQSQRHLAQISKINPINATHITALEALRKSDMVVRQLQRESDLKGRISQTNRPHTKVNELVSYNTLADSIEEEFTMKSNMDATEVGNYLIKFFDYLIGSYPQEFIENQKEVRNVSLINENIIFAGYIILAKRMRENKIDISKLSHILNNINFNKDNQDWVERGVLTEDRNISTNAKSGVKAFFKKLELNELSLKG